MVSSLFGLALVAAAASAQLTNIQCAAPGGVHVMIAAGCAIPCVTHGYGFLDTLIGNVTAAFPGSTTYLTPYDNSTTQGRDSSITMIQEAEAHIAACPCTPLVFIGYSLGGIINMNTLCGGIPASAAKNVLASIVRFADSTLFRRV